MHDNFSLSEFVVSIRSALQSKRAEQVLAATTRNESFTVVQTATGQLHDGEEYDLIVVDCKNDQVPNRNEVGIKTRERLCIVIPLSLRAPPQVRPLRRDFPRKLPHLNLVRAGEPASLCLYFEPWTVMRRTWTAEKFLQRILVWLADSARGTLHREGQPLEPLYFFGSTPQLALPADAPTRLSSDDQQLVIRGVAQARTFLGQFVATDVDTNGPAFTVLVAQAPPAEHGLADSWPTDLGMLHDQLLERGSTLLGPLQEAIRRSIPSSGLPVGGERRCIVLLQLQLKSAGTAVAEPAKLQGFIVDESVTALGAKLEVLIEQSGRFYAPPMLGPATPPAPGWRSVGVTPLEVRVSLSVEETRKSSGLPSSVGDESFVLAGVGALGSAMIELWSREGWGSWTIIDDDYVEPHNLIRHSSKWLQVGLPKVEAVGRSIVTSYSPNEYKVDAIRADVSDFANNDVMKALATASLVVDATTMLGVPRELALRADIGRCMSTFLTPSGTDSVLLVEDAQRTCRLDNLEIQYYAALLDDDWGLKHLVGNQGELFPGFGCRDATAIMSIESVSLHASLLARQVRVAAGKAEAMIRVLQASEETGAVRSIDVPVSIPVEQRVGDWRVVTHEGVRTRLLELCTERAPLETGGVLLGYVDHVVNTIFVVKALSAPPDSQELRNGFVRGKDGLEQHIASVGIRTGRIVAYVGEWHSHPPSVSVTPSEEDDNLLQHLAKALSADGEPALMMIIGTSGEMSVSLRAISGA